MNSDWPGIQLMAMKWDGMNETMVYSDIVTSRVANVTAIVIWYSQVAIHSSSDHNPCCY